MKAISRFHIKLILLCAFYGCLTSIHTNVDALLYHQFQTVPSLSRVDRQLQTPQQLSTSYDNNSSEFASNQGRNYHDSKNEHLTTTRQQQLQQYQQQQYNNYQSVPKDINESYQEQHHRYPQHHQFEDVINSQTDTFGCPLECVCNRIAQIADCADRNLTRVPASFPREIKRIRLERNDIKEIGPYAFQGLKRLQRIDLSNNNLQRIDASAFAGGLQSLNSLILYSNKLERLPPNLFSEVPQLQLLLLNANSLQTIHKDLFQTLANLSLLSLYDNNIETLQSGTFDGLMSIKTLHLGKNPLRCDCNLRWLSDYLGANPVETSEARCETAWNARSSGKKLSQLKKAEFKCAEPAEVGAGNKGQQVDLSGCPVGCICSGSTVDCSPLGLGSSREQRAGAAPPPQQPQPQPPTGDSSGSLYELPDIPDDVPVYVARVHINDQRIKRIRQTGLFRRLANSQKLDLGNNKIIDIEDNAINGQFSNGQKPERVVFVLLENQHCSARGQQQQQQTVEPQQPLDPCSGAPKVNEPQFDSACYNGGSCRPTTTGPTGNSSTAPNYTCMCPPGFAGPLCEINIDDCVDHQCQNGAACLDGVSSYRCLCRDPTTSGEFCEQLAATSSAAPTLSFPYATSGGGGGTGSSTLPLVAAPLALPIISTAGNQHNNNNIEHPISTNSITGHQPSGQQILARSADFSRAPSDSKQIQAQQESSSSLDSLLSGGGGGNAGCQRLTQRKYYEDGNGCQSVRLLKLSTCAGTCSQAGNCCQPSRVKRRRVRMQCSDGASYVKTIDLIKKCSCANGATCSGPGSDSRATAAASATEIDTDQNKSSSSQYFKYLTSTTQHQLSAASLSGPASSSQEEQLMRVDAVD